MSICLATQSIYGTFQASNTSFTPNRLNMIANLEGNISVWPIAQINTYNGTDIKLIEHMKKAFEESVAFGTKHIVTMAGT